MFLRVVRASGGKGVKHEYLRLVEAYRDDAGKTQHRTILNLGRIDLLATHLDIDKLNRLLHGTAKPKQILVDEKIEALAAWDWGPMLATRHLWNELGLARTLTQLGGRSRDGVSLSERALVLVANRLTAPTSEHGLARWLETDFVRLDAGRRLNSMQVPFRLIPE